MTHASLFSGIGGPEVAASMLGWDNLFHCEINEFGRKVLDYWFPNSKSYEDITKTDFSEWHGKVDILTGGFPCQPFSYAGKRRGADDDRYLWPYMFKAIDAIRPTWIVAENVAGITTMVEHGEVSEMGGQASMFEEVDGLYRYRLKETFTLQRICDDLEGLGYSVQPVLVPACAVGAPHRRDRVFIVTRRFEAVSENTMHGGQIHRSNEEQGSERNERHTCAGGGERICSGTSRTDSPNTDSRGRREVDEHLESELADGAKPVSNGGQRNVADTIRLETERRNATNTENDGSRGETRSAGEATARPHGQSDEQYSVGCCFWHVGPDDPRFAENGIAGQERWAKFPSVSPVHRGNDGIPFDVDRLAIPFSKWITDSLKAYGNAIVPQVMYEIFRFIEIVEKGVEP